MTKTVLTSFTILCLLSTIFLMKSKTSVVASLDNYVWNDKNKSGINDSGDLNYTTLSDAVVEAESYDTICVEPGTYNTVAGEIFPITIGIEGLTIKSTQEAEKTVIIGNASYGDSIRITAENVTFVGFAVKGATEYWNAGICLENTRHCNISGNIASNNFWGICLSHSFDNVVSGNNASFNDINSIRLENSSNNILIGNIASESYAGIALDSSSNNTLIANYVSKNIWYGIDMTESFFNVVSGNNASFNVMGIELSYSSFNIVADNEAFGNSEAGIHLFHSSDNTLSANTVSFNRGIGSGWGILLEDSSDNLLNGNVVFNNWLEAIYLHSSSNNNILTGNNVSSNGFDGIYLSHSNTNSIYENSITNNQYGISLWSSSNNSIFGNNITANNQYGIGLYDPKRNIPSHYNTISGNSIVANGEYGIYLQSGSIYAGMHANNTISGNNIANNNWGIYLLRCSNNSIYHNNFINNTFQAYAGSSWNFWDNGLEGNYWSDYSGTDADKDGIGDTPYTAVPYNLDDNYPLMGIFSDFSATYQEETYHIITISNSTISDFQFDHRESTISFNVTGENKTIGFCRVSIPHELMNISSIIVIIDDGLTPVLYHNYTLYDNGTHRWIYFAYEHSTHEIDIIPEFQLAILLPLLMIFTFFTVMLSTKKRRYASKQLQ